MEGITILSVHYERLNGRKTISHYIICQLRSYIHQGRPCKCENKRKISFKFAIQAMYIDEYTRVCITFTRKNSVNPWESHGLRLQARVEKIYTNFETHSLSSFLFFAIYFHCDLFLLLVETVDAYVLVSIHARFEGGDRVKKYK